MNIGFVGLGDMGAGIVPRLIAAGHDVTGWNRSAGKNDALIEIGMAWGESPAAVAAASEITFSCVTDAAAIRAVVLYAGVPNADRFDPDFEQSSLEFRCVDWRAEPVLDSEHDARTRIYLVTPTLFGTKAVKGEMIIYPPGTQASNHHHEGAGHFQYIIGGSGTVLLSEEPHPISAGDTLYNYEFERHNFINDGDEELIFVEYFVPAECTTVWTNPELVCAWLPTGKNIDGGEPSRSIAAHSSAETVNPEGV